MFLEIKDFFTNEECDLIINKCSAFIDPKKVLDEYNRQGNSVELNNHEKLSEIDKLVYERLTFFIKNRLSYAYNIFGVNAADTGYSFHRYYKGDKLYTHSDDVFGHEGINKKFNPRILSCIIMLTDNENADLIFPRHNVNIKTEKKKFVCFLPHKCYEHYMNNNSNKNRDVLVTWIVDKNIECVRL
jgi:hypothetical protein|tara:strand:+ start:122 stop:679 length:558 start_codon:yes stop_codon:yes gene_type:complete